MPDCIGADGSRARWRIGLGLWRASVACAATYALTACAAIEQMPQPNEAGARPVQALPGWRAETAAGLRTALSAQCQANRLRHPWPRLCARLQAKAPLPGSAWPVGFAAKEPDATLKSWVARHFDAWPVIDAGGGRAGLLTGYFEPLLPGSRQRESTNQVPLYGPPADLPARQPYLTRGEIEQGGAPGLRGRELVWLDDPIDAFFLHIQGSGRIQLRDGSVMRLGFAAHNGQPYTAIGRALIRQGAIARKDMSAQSIKEWLRDNPVKGRTLMQTNPRYIFFRKLRALPDRAGPPGSLAVPLTSLRSVATDRRFVPAGSLLYLDSQLPVSAPWRVGLALSQDTGAAITGQVRADLFTGTGAQAGELAGLMRQPLKMWLLWPKGSVPPPQIPVARGVVNP